ncbi:MAG TPA: hypothetical protein VKV28_02020 [Candidatus Binataceae bacterium]|nr:hypothetical protein [Candidatus Binataceae bacterium]
MTDDGPKLDLHAAIARFNQGDYFAAGESFELLANSTEQDRPLLEALNRIAAGLHLRFERGGRQATINLLSQAMLALEDLRPSYAGIDIERLCQELSAFNDDLRQSPRELEVGALRYRAQLFLERRRAPRIVFQRTDSNQQG